MGSSLPNSPKQKSSRGLSCQDDYGFSCDDKICNNTSTWKTELTACLGLGKVLFLSQPYCVLPDNQCLNTGWSCNPNVKFPLRPEVTLPAEDLHFCPQIDAFNEFLSVFTNFITNHLLKALTSYSNLWAASHIATHSLLLTTSMTHCMSCCISCSHSWKCVPILETSGSKSAPATV